MLKGNSNLLKRLKEQSETVKEQNTQLFAFDAEMELALEALASVVRKLGK